MLVLSRCGVVVVWWFASSVGCVFVVMVYTVVDIAAAVTRQLHHFASLAQQVTVKEGRTPQKCN